MTKIAVTGINGFVGKHLARELSSNGIEVIGIGMDGQASSEISRCVDHYFMADLSMSWPDIGDVDAVVHLAGLAAVGPSFTNPQKYISVNSSMFTLMAEYYLGRPTRPRLVVVSSGAIYGSLQPMPLKEQSDLGYSSPYAISKVLVENQCKYYINRGLDCIVVRPFNHIGPGQGSGFLVPDLIDQLRQSNSVTVGDLSTKRDYTDVRDIARAYRLLATTQNLTQSVYNACSGHSTSGKEILELIQNAMKKESADVIIDTTKIRPNDPNEIYGSADALHNDTGWTPSVSLKDTICDIVSFDN